MISCFLIYPNTPVQQSTLPLLTRKSTSVGLVGLTYKTGKLMIKRIPHNLGSKGVTCSAVDFESTAGRLVPSPPEPQRAGVLITSQSPRPEGSASLSPLVAQATGQDTANRSCCILLEKPPPTDRTQDPASLEGGTWLGQVSCLHCQQAQIPQPLEGVGLYPPVQGSLL